jgi:hypothetical protein
MEVRLTIIALQVLEYAAARKFAANGIIRGMLYDGWTAAYALNAGADILHTWNTAHSRMLREEVAQKGRTP